MTRKKKLTNEEGLEDKVKKNLSKEEVEEISLKRYLEWWNKIRFDAMDLYLNNHDWIAFCPESKSFKILRHQEHFEKIDGLEFEEAINAVRVYEKKVLKME